MINILPKSEHDLSFVQGIVSTGLKSAEKVTFVFLGGE